VQARAQSLDKRQEIKMDVTFHTQGQGEKAVDPEALPPEQILALAADLTKDSFPDQIKVVLGKAAKSALGPIEKEKAIRAIQLRTGTPVRALKQELDLIELKVGSDSHVRARVLANAMLTNSFNSGKHLLRSADGSYWAFNQRLWQSTSNAALCKLLMIEAAKTQPSCANMQQLVSNAKKTLDYMLGGDEDLMGFNADPLPMVNCVNGEVWLDKDGKPELCPHDPASLLTSCPRRTASAPRKSSWRREPAPRLHRGRDGRRPKGAYGPACLPRRDDALGGQTGHEEAGSVQKAQTPTRRSRVRSQKGRRPQSRQRADAETVKSETEAIVGR
jgi:hypothetical protein